ncbi:hypothetical protein ACVW2K_002921 [Nocardioides sp. HB32]
MNYGRRSSTLEPIPLVRTCFSTDSTRPLIGMCVHLIAADPVTRFVKTLSLGDKGLHPGHYVSMGVSGRFGWFYLPGTALVIFVAFGLGSAHADARCTPESADCDLGPLFGVVWTLVALAVWVGVIVVVELLLRTKSRS